MTRWRWRLVPILESDSFEFMRRYVLYEREISFQIPIGLDPALDDRIIVREVPREDAPTGQMRGRTLPVASACFANEPAAALLELNRSGSDSPNA